MWSRKVPTRLDLITNLGEAYQKQGRLDDAIKEYQTAINLKSGLSLSVHYNLGMAYQQQGRLDDAIKEYQTAIKLKPDYAVVHYNLGWLISNRVTLMMLSRNTRQR